MIGKTISHYKILEKIGSGGMGIVYKAQDLKLDRFVALKFLPPHLTSSEDEKQRFIHEAKAASALQHNNICNIHEIDETEDGQLFICMDYYEGDTLDKRIREKPLPIDEATDIAIQIAQGLAKAHEKEIVHRDIKPANIMLTADRVVKILDFGLAKLSTQTKLTKESTTLGTVSYMSPEQAKGEEVDCRTDIWSLGVILYEMLTGQLPFKGEYESAVIYSILNDTQEPVTGLRTGMPMELERIINKCLQKNPANRYQHVDELMVDLRSIKRESESASIPTKKEHPSKRSKLIKMSIAVFSILILIVAGYFILIQPSEKRVSGWENSIAVLPFDNISNDPEQEYFCEGMTEQIISNLARLPRLKVIARQSVMKFKDSDKTISEIGEELDVVYVLESSIRKFGNRIRVTAQLINAKDDFHVWSEDYDREYQDLFNIQDEVSKAIATNLLANISPQEKTEIKTNRPKNTEAYEYLLKGRYFYNKFISTLNDVSDEQFSKEQVEYLNLSENMFKKSIKLDPNFADSYANLAVLYFAYSWAVAQNEEEKDQLLTLFESNVELSFQLDSTSAQVNYAKGIGHDAKDEYDKAFDSYKTAIRINPSNDKYYDMIGMFVMRRGCYNLAIKCYSKAIELNPLIQLYYRRRGYWHLYTGKYDKAERDITKGLEIDANHYGTQSAYWLLLITMKRYDEAENLLARMETTHPDRRMDSKHALQYAVKGQKEKALNTLKSGQVTLKKLLYTILGMKDEALNLLNEDIERYERIKSSRFLILNSYSIYDNLRSDPRFQEILAKHKEIYEENLAKYGDIEELLN